MKFGHQFPAVSDHWSEFPVFADLERKKKIVLWEQKVVASLLWLKKKFKLKVKLD